MLWFSRYHPAVLEVRVTGLHCRDRVQQRGRPGRRLFYLPVSLSLCCFAHVCVTHYVSWDSLRACVSCCLLRVCSGKRLQQRFSQTFYVKQYILCSSHDKIVKYLEAENILYLSDRLFMTPQSVFFSQVKNTFLFFFFERERTGPDFYSQSTSPIKVT